MKKIGVRIKKKRESLEMTLGALAAEVDLSSSCLSQFENSKAFPSIVTLKKIAVALHTTVGELIGENERLPENPLMKAGEIKFVRENPEGTRLYLLSHHDSSKLMEAYSLHFPKNASSEGIMTPHQGQAFLHVLKGKIRFVLDGKDYSLENRDNLYFDSHLSHKAYNDNSRGESSVLWIVSPPNI